MTPDQLREVFPQLWFWEMTQLVRRNMELMAMPYVMFYDWWWKVEPTKVRREVPYLRLCK